MSSYFIRFTPFDDRTNDLASVTATVDKLEPSKFVVAREHAKREHYHIAVWGVKRTPESLRAFLKKDLEGQIYISGKEIQDKITAIAYCFKDGDYIHQGLNVDEFLQAHAVSKRKIKFDDELSKIEEAYEGDDKKFIGDILDLHAKTNKKPYLQHIKAQLLLTKLKKDKYGTYRTYLIDKIIDNM